jgi:hypothetical protein
MSSLLLPGRLPRLIIRVTFIQPSLSYIQVSRKFIELGATLTNITIPISARNQVEAEKIDLERSD